MRPATSERNWVQYFNGAARRGGGFRDGSILGHATFIPHSTISAVSVQEKWFRIFLFKSVFWCVLVKVECCVVSNE